MGFLPPIQAKSISGSFSANLSNKEKFLYESDDLSYTDAYFKVNLLSKKNKIKSGSIIEGTVISVNNGKFQVEV